MAFGREDDDRPTRGNHAVVAHTTGDGKWRMRKTLLPISMRHISRAQVTHGFHCDCDDQLENLNENEKKLTLTARLWLFFCRWWSFNHHYVDGNFRARQCRTDTSNAFSHSITFESQLRCVYDDSSGRRVAIEANEMWVWHDVPAISSSWQIVLMLLIV